MTHKFIYLRNIVSTNKFLKYLPFFVNPAFINYKNFLKICDLLVFKITESFLNLVKNSLIFLYLFNRGGVSCLKILFFCVA